MRIHLVATLALALAAPLAGACHPVARPTVAVRAEARFAVAQAIAAANAAQRDRDLDGYLATVDAELAASARAELARDWATVTAVVDVQRKIAEVGEVTGDRAVVITELRYERRVSRAGAAEHVLTTGRQEERWVRRADGWKLAAVKDLGGETLVNGRPMAAPVATAAN